jgi:hypothetical protein
MAVKRLVLVAFTVCSLAINYRTDAQESAPPAVNPTPASAYPQPSNQQVIAGPSYKLDAGSAVLATNDNGQAGLKVTQKGADGKAIESGGLLDDLVVVQNGQQLTVEAIKGLFQESTPVLVVTDFDRLVPANVVDANAILIYAPRGQYEELVAKGRTTGKFRAILDCVYADGKTRVEGMWKITGMRINGVAVADLKAVVDGNTVYFSRKHTKSEVHLFALEPGQYEVEFEAEATFEGKFFKHAVGRGAFMVAGRDAVGKVVFDKDR